MTENFESNYESFIPEKPPSVTFGAASIIGSHLHGGMGEDWNDPMTAGALSRWILWGKPSLRESFNDFKKLSLIHI